MTRSTVLSSALLGLIVMGSFGLAVGDPPAPVCPPVSPPPPAPVCPNPTPPIDADPPAPPAASPLRPPQYAGVEDACTRGARYFDQAIAWIARDGALGQAKDLYVHADIRWDLYDLHFEGAIAVWYVVPDQMRLDISMLQRTTTKVLNGDRAWTVDAAGATHMLTMADAERFTKRMRADMAHVAHFAQFLTLEGLKGPGVVFEHQGNFRGTGAYEGDWIKVARRSPEGRKITFFLNQSPDSKTGEMRASWPGVVRLDGDAASQLDNEDWILRDWENPSAAPRASRYPLKIQIYRSNPDPAMAKQDPARRFLTAVIDDIRINAGIDPSQLEPPPVK